MAEEIYNAFRHMEHTEDLFKSPFDIPMWDSIRSMVMSDILEEKNVNNKAHDDFKLDIRSLTDILENNLRGFTTKNPFLQSSSDLLVVGHSRRKKINEKWWDIYFDYFLDELDQSYVYLDRPYQLNHFKPLETENVAYTDLLEFPCGIVRKLGKGVIQIDSHQKKYCKKIQNSIKKNFDIEIDIEKYIIDELILEKILTSEYKYLLDRINPSLVLIAVSYDTRRTLVRACKRMSIPVIEFQHGVIHSNHLGYSYPYGQKNVVFPDYIYTWGNYWSESINYPIPSDHVIDVGFPHFEQLTSEFSTQKEGDGTLFISQGTIGTKLSKLAINYAKKHPSKNIIYKLHPGEYNRWKSEYPWLKNSNVNVIQNDNKPLYYYFEKCNKQVGVSSTALFEGLAFNIDTYVYNLPGCEVMEPTYNGNYACLISKSDEIKNRVPQRRMPTQKLFRKNSVSNIINEIEKVIE